MKKIDQGNKEQFLISANLYQRRPFLQRAVKMQEIFDVATEEGIMRGLVGDWLVEGVAGEVYPVKNHIFKQIYEPDERTT